jgi:hypothetical protein
MVIMERRPTRSISARRSCSILTTLTIAASLAAAAAQPADAGSIEAGDSVEARPAAMRTRVYVGMWSTHLRDLNRGLGANSLIGLAYRGFFGATFVNSYGNRAVSVGLQRSFSAPKDGAVTTALGYRVGIITGYDDRFLGIGDKLPALPFAQLVAGMDIRNVGVELAYAGIVASVTLNWRL